MTSENNTNLPNEVIADYAVWVSVAPDPEKHWEMLDFSPVDTLLQEEISVAESTAVTQPQWEMVS